MTEAPAPSHYLIRQRRLDAELAEEIEAHRAMRQVDLEAPGMAPNEAPRAPPI